MLLLQLLPEVGQPILPHRGLLLTRSRSERRATARGSRGGYHAPRRFQSLGPGSAFDEEQRRVAPQPLEPIERARLLDEHVDHARRRSRAGASRSPRCPRGCRGAHPLGAQRHLHRLGDGVRLRRSSARCRRGSSRRSPERPCRSSTTRSRAFLSSAARRPRRTAASALERAIGRRPRYRGARGLGDHAVRQAIGQAPPSARVGGGPRPRWAARPPATSSAPRPRTSPRSRDGSRAASSVRTFWAAGASGSNALPLRGTTTSRARRGHEPRLVPREEIEEGLRADDQVEVTPRPQRLERVHRVGGPRSAGARRRTPGSADARATASRVIAKRWTAGASSRDRLVRGHRRGHEEQAVEPQRLGDLVGDEQMAEVDRVEGATEHADARGQRATPACARRPSRRTWWS